MDQLTAATQIVLANTYQMAFKTQSYHWNVEGPSFNDYHAFFQGIYEELFGAVDEIAEHIRTLDSYAPFSLSNLLLASTVTNDVAIVKSTQQMFANLLAANEQVIQSLNITYNLAKVSGNEGFAVFISQRLDTHAKHGWMIRSHLKPVQ